MYACFDIGGSSLKYAVVNKDAEIMVKGKIDILDDVEIIFRMIEEQVTIFQKRFIIEGVCLSAPGAVDCETGVIKGYSALPSIHGPSWKVELKERLKLPVSIENDANCAALAEVVYGKGKDLNDLLFLVIGSGVGGTIIKDKKVHHGKHLSGGEFGYAIFQQTNGTVSTFSDLASTRALVTNARKEAQCDCLSGEDVFRLAKEGDLMFQELVDEFYYQLAVGIYNLQYIYDPEMILLSGAVSAQSNFISNIYMAYENVLKDVKIADIRPVLSLCKHKTEANLIGAFVHHQKEYNQS